MATDRGEARSPFERVLVQVVTHQSREWVPRLASALEHAPAVTIVDNASTDGSAEAMGASLSTAHVLRSPVNIGFGAAHNLAAKHGLGAWPQAEFLLILNPDCLMTEEALSVLVLSLDEQPGAGAVGPKLVYADGTTQTSHRLAFFQKGRASDGASTGPAVWLSGACLLVRRTAWEAVRGFDPRYFLYYEDDDLCLRLQQSGWRCSYEPRASVVHARGTGSRPTWMTLASKSFHLARSKRLAIRTWVGALGAWMYRARLLLGCLIAVPVYTIALQPSRVIKWAARGMSAFAAIDRPWREPPGELPAEPGRIW